MIWSTVIQQVIKENQIKDVYESLTNIEIFLGKSGIYSFWNVQTREVLYVGLARNLGDRYKQHFGMSSSKESGCKVKEIKEYLKDPNNQGCIGYSIIVSGSPNFNYGKNIFPDAKNTIMEIEGNFIEFFRQKNGKKPIWNKIGGSVEGAKKVKKEFGWFIDCISGNGPFNSPCSILELDKDAEALILEQRTWSPLRWGIAYGAETSCFFELIESLNHFHLKRNFKYEDAFNKMTRWKREYLEFRKNL